MAEPLDVVYTDKRLRDFEKEIRGVYEQAQRDIEKKTESFFQKAAEREKVMSDKLAKGTITQDEFNKWKRGQIFAGDNWTAQKASIEKVLSDTNKIATQMLNGQKADVFAFAGNYTAFEFEKGFGVNFGFDLYDVDAVTKLVRDNPKILPKEFLNRKKDEGWNAKTINSQITQGIIQGEPIPKIAKRLSEAIPARNQKQMTLHARTAMTSAHNMGKMSRFKEAEDLGIKFHKVWYASLDNRTRDTHRELDGQKVLPDEPFEVDGMEIMCPGDPDAEPELTWNCRCTMKTELDDYPREFQRRAYEEVEDEDGNVHRESYMTDATTYREWEAKKRNADAPVPQ